MIDSDQRPYSKRHPLMSLSQITVRFKGILKLVSFPNSQIYIWPIYWLGHMSVTSLDQRFPNNLVLQTYPVKINSERKNIGFHWTNCPVYKILGLYKRALFDLQFVHNLFWLKLKWNARSKLFYCIIYRSSILWWSSMTLTKSQKRFKERKYQYLKYKNKNYSGPDT
jgi:hypothetical protein